MIHVKNEEEFLTKQIIKEDQVSFIYFHTPMCGTCMLARQFLELIEKIEKVPSIYEADINYFKLIAKEWEIKSVPSFVAFKGEKVIEKLYAFESVTKVYEFMKRHHSF